jgi:hypothetical protein
MVASFDLNPNPKRPRSKPKYEYDNHNNHHPSLNIICTIHNHHNPLIALNNYQYDIDIIC